MEFPNVSEYSFIKKKSFHKTRDIVYIDPECVVFILLLVSKEPFTESEMLKLLIIMLT